MARQWLWRTISCHNKNNCSAKQLCRNRCFWYSSPLTQCLFSFHHSQSLCRLLAEDGDDGTGWIFNRFVSGSTIGGRIVVNIITYRSLPCQTGAITHSSPLPTPPRPNQRTNTHTSLSHFSVTVPVYTGWLCPCLLNLLTLRPASLRSVIHPFQKILAALFVLASSTEVCRACKGLIIPVGVWMFRKFNWLLGKWLF